MKILKNRFFIAAVCIVLAALIAFLLLPMLNRKTREVTSVVRVKETIPKDTLITDDLLTTADVGAYGLPGGTIKDIQKVVGKYAAVTLFKGDNIFPAKLSSDDGSAEYRMGNLTAEGKMAVSVTIKTLAAGLSGKLQIGDVATVYAAIPQSSGNGFAVKRYPELKYLEIIAITNDKAQDVQEETPLEEDKILPTVVTFSVTSAQAKRLVEIESVGLAHLAFIGRDAAAKKLLLEFTNSAAATTEDAEAFDETTSQISENGEIIPGNSYDAYYDSTTVEKPQTTPISLPTPLPQTTLSPESEVG